TDYVLTVAVSTASGIAAITSAVPSLAPYALELGLVGIVALCAGNLRGVKQAGNLFAFPTYLFIAAVGVVIVVGLVDAASRGFAAEPHPPVVATEGVGLLLVLRAFSSGATAMTGIEAISDGVPAFRPPEWRNARTTLTAMVSILLFLFVGTVLLVQLEGVIPMADETVLSQLAHDTVGSGVLYWVVQISTAAVLLLAANTAFSDFPRLLFFLARDRNAPLAFLRMGDRLAFSNGILLLTAAAVALYVGFDGKTSRLIPLFAVGVFLAFTLSQSGMVVHWWRGREAGWRRSLAFNAVGAVLSAAVLLIAGLTKFTEGAWVVALLIPALVFVFSRVHRYYMGVRAAVALPDDEAAAPRRGRIVPHRWGDGAPGAGGPGALAGAGSAAGERADAPDELALMTVVCLTTLDLPALRALAYAASLGQPVLAVHISPDEDDARRFAKRWAAWGDHLPLEIVSSPYRAVVAPLTRYLEALAAQRPDLTLTVVVPQQVAGRWWMQPLHDHVGRRLHRALRARPGIIVTMVPFHL
ncbi:MAG TPA: APC family permease, partial [Solirubrobacteraceae bacterium]|nr:APC family permease [Solirubrobacteraceae bacterium]